MIDGRQEILVYRLKAFIYEFFEQPFKLVVIIVSSCCRTSGVCRLHALVDELTDIALRRQLIVLVDSDCLVF